ncbi:MAG: carbohydrate binding family 9 domain-containing protein [bacterium]|nr:carbohydrate binding family 9 domain-containing protein [bacterium]
MKRNAVVSVHRIVLLLTLILLPVAALAQFQPAITPTMVVSSAPGEIEIDGILDDEGWLNAGQATGFSEVYPGDNTEPLKPTTVYLTYSDSHLYVAFVCNDDPNLIRATMCQRDQFFNDDEVGIQIDTFGEGQWAYEFIVNPYGIQKDLMWTNVQGSDRGFDMIWHSAASITDEGYIVEMAIPFSGMRFPAAEVQNWRLNFQRTHPRESTHQSTWAARDRNDQCRPCQWGFVQGVNGVSAGKGLEFLPAMIGYQTAEIENDLDGDSGMSSEDIMGEVSLGAKYSVTSDITLEATINPDYSQIEADADQINVNTTILQRFPERRPFFQEGNDLFRTYFNSFYTRMVVDPVVAVKGTARWSKSSVAAFYASDENSPYIIPTEERSYMENLGRSDVSVLRGLHSLGNNSQVGFMLTDRRYDAGGVGTIYAGDANFRLTNTLSLMGQFVHSETEESDGIEISPGETFADGKYTVDLDGEKYNGNAFITELRRSADHWNFVLDYNQVGQTYRTQTGYDPWNDQRNSFIYTNYNINFEEGMIERISPSAFVNGRWNMAGHRKWLHSSAGVDVRLRWAQTNFSFNYERGEEVWSDILFDELWSARFRWDSRPWDRLGYYMMVQISETPALFSLERGDQVRASFALDIKPMDNLIIEPTLDYIRSDDHSTGELLFEQVIARARVRLQLSRRLSLRLVVQHNNSENPPYREEAIDGNFPRYHMYFGGKWEVDPLLTYRVNSFSVFYLGSTHDFRDFQAASQSQPTQWRQTSRQYFMKIQYLFQM